jgi:hypothetical protein
MYKIYSIDTNNLSSQEANLLFQTNKLITNKYNFLNRFTTLQSFCEDFLTKFTSETSDLYYIKKEDLYCGIITIKKGAAWDGSEQYEMNITFSNVTADNSLINTIDLFLEDKLLEYKHIEITVYNKELESSVEKYNGKTKFLSDHFGLTKDNINIDQLNETITTIENRNRKLNLRFFNSVPDEYIKDWCDIFNETSRDMPDEKEEAFIPYHATVEVQLKSKERMKSNNIHHYCYMIFNDKNEAIAESNVRVDNNNPRFPYQFMIGVKKEYRGLNLGKWMYASMYKKLYETIDFEKVEVVHHIDNKYAIAISKFVGYEYLYSVRSSCISL